MDLTAQSLTESSSQHRAMSIEGTSIFGEPLKVGIQNMQAGDKWPISQLPGLNEKVGHGSAGWKGQCPQYVGDSPVMSASLPDLGRVFPPVAAQDFIVSALERKRRGKNGSGKNDPVKLSTHPVAVDWFASQPSVLKDG